MIEKKFIDVKMREFRIKEWLAEALGSIEHSKKEIIQTPLGVKIIIHTSKPGLLVGRGGSTIQNLTSMMKEKFNLEAPQIEVVEITEPALDPQILSERIVAQLTRFGVSKFKAIAHSSVEESMGAGAQGIEIKMAGRIPGSRAKYWKFSKGYVPKSGQPRIDDVSYGFSTAKLKIGSIGVTVRLLKPGVKMPDDVTIRGIPVVEDVAAPVEQKIEEAVAEPKVVKRKRGVKRGADKKK